MLRKSLAILLIVSWIILSGFDVVEDLDLPDEVQLCNPSEADLPGSRHPITFANNIVESATTESGRDPVIVAKPLVRHSPLLTLAVSHSKLKLHKVHSIFLI